MNYVTWRGKGEKRREGDVEKERRMRRQGAREWSREEKGVKRWIRKVKIKGDRGEVISLTQAWPLSAPASSSLWGRQMARRVRARRGTSRGCKSEAALKTQQREKRGEGKEAEHAGSWRRDQKLRFQKQVKKDLMQKAGRSEEKKRAKREKLSNQDGSRSSQEKHVELN